MKIHIKANCGFKSHLRGWRNGCRKIRVCVALLFINA